MIQRMHGSSFDWTNWRGGSISDLGIPCRKESIISNHLTLKQYAIGWCDGSEIMCRPKLNHIAVMFLKDDSVFWFHLQTEEFNTVFKNK